MLIANISAVPLTLASIYTIPAGGQATIPYTALENDRSFVGYVDANQLLILDAEESFTLGSLPRFTQGMWFPPQALTAGQTGITPTIGTTSNPVTLWVAPFQVVRVYINVTAGDLTATFQDSPDGGTTYYPSSDLPTLTATYSGTGTGLESVLLPAGLCLLKPILSSANGGTGNLYYARQS